MEVYFVIFRFDVNFVIMDVYVWCNFYVWYIISFIIMEVYDIIFMFDI